MRDYKKLRGGNRNRLWERRERRRQRDRDGPSLIYGWHAVQAALENPKRRIRRILVTPNGERRLHELGLKPKVKPEIVRPEVIDRQLSPDAVHQGVLLEADPLPSPELEDMSLDGLVLVLDQITDPHNFGAITMLAALLRHRLAMPIIDSALKRISRRSFEPGRLSSGRSRNPKAETRSRSA
jgi:23S rRNA (guanosine2251-2'-O)-methyltransferase